MPGYHLCSWTERGQHSFCPAHMCSGRISAGPANRRDFPLASLWRQHREWLTTLTSCRWQDASADYRLSWAVMPTVKVLACWDANFTPVPFTVAFQLTPSRSQIRAWRYRATFLLSFYVPVQRFSSSRKSSDLSCTHREDHQAEAARHSEKLRGQVRRMAIF